MNREDVIRLAGEAGFGANQRNTLLVKIERFADLVLKEMIKDGWRQCAKGQHTTQFCGMAEKAREEEREECAKRNLELASLECGSNEAIQARKSQ